MAIAEPSTKVLAAFTSYNSVFRKPYFAQSIIYQDAKTRGLRVSLVAYLKLLKQMILVVAYEKNKGEKLGRIREGARNGTELADAIRCASASNFD